MRLKGRLVIGIFAFLLNYSIIIDTKNWFIYPWLDYYSDFTVIAHSFVKPFVNNRFAAKK